MCTLYNHNIYYKPTPLQRGVFDTYYKPTPSLTTRTGPWLITYLPVLRDNTPGPASSQPLSRVTQTLHAAVSPRINDPGGFDQARLVSVLRILCGELRKSRVDGRYKVYLESESDLTLILTLTLTLTITLTLSSDKMSADLPRQNAIARY